METKPRAEVEFVGFEVRIGNSICYKRTKKEAEACAKEWEARKVKEWEERNSEETKARKMHDDFWFKMQYFVEDLKTDAKLAGKRGDKAEVDCIRRIRERIENKMAEAKGDA